MQRRSEDKICSELRELFERDDDTAALAGLPEFFGRALRRLATLTHPK